MNLNFFYQIHIKINTTHTKAWYNFNNNINSTSIYIKILKLLFIATK